MWRFLVLAAIVALPVGHATGILPSAPIQVIIENDHRGDCVDEPTGFCLVTANESRVDVAQNVSTFLVVLDLSEYEERTGVELLPDRAVVFDASMLFLPHPVFVILTEDVRSVKGPGDMGARNGIDFDRDGFYTRWWGPGVKEPEAPPDDHWVRIDYGDDWIGYDHLGPFNVVGGSDSHHMSRSYTGAVCIIVRGGCASTAAAVREPVIDATPAVAFGLSVGEAGAGLSPEALTADVAALERGEGGSLTGRAPVSGPQRALERQGPAGALLMAGAAQPRPEPAPARNVAPSALRPPAAPLEERVVPASPAGGVPVALAVAASFALAVVLAALWARISRRDEALRSGHRARILARLQSSGPTTLMQLARELGMDRTTVKHHLRVLKRGTPLVVERHGSNVVVSLPGQDTSALTRTATTTAQRIVVDALRAAGGALARPDLHARLGALPVRTRNRAVSELTARGLVRREWDERGERVVLKPASGSAGPVSRARTDPA